MTEMVQVTPQAIEAADPAQHAALITAALVESKSWLAVASRNPDPTPIAEFRAWAVLVEEATKQKRLGREIELDAAQMVRRAERGLGLAIRQGQEAGRIRQRGDNTRTDLDQGADDTLVSPKDAAQVKHSSDLVDLYALAETSDEQFEAALVEAKDEGNLSRANVKRKVTGEAPPAPRPEVLRRTRHHDSNRIVEQTVISLEGLCLGVPLIDYTQLDSTQVSQWAESLRSSLRTLNRLAKELQA